MINDLLDQNDRFAREIIELDEMIGIIEDQLTDARNDRDILFEVVCAVATNDLRSHYNRKTTGELAQMARDALEQITRK